jgi:hypothetical protein
VLVFRYLMAEVFKSQLSIFLVLMTIFTSHKFVRVLADASEGDIPGQVVASVILLACFILPFYKRQFTSQQFVYNIRSDNSFMDFREEIRFDW